MLAALTFGLVATVTRGMLDGVVGGQYEGLSNLTLLRITLGETYLINNDIRNFAHHLLSYVHYARYQLQCPEYHPDILSCHGYPSLLLIVM